MRRTWIVLAFTAVMAGTAAAQTVSQRGHIRAFGEASVAVTPDLAKLSVSITTQAATAQEASTQNATKSTAVFNALKQALGASGEIKTISYMVTPVYTYPRDGSPVLTGFTATNVVEVTISDLNRTGGIIDTAISAGATRVDSLRLTLKDEEPARAQALRLAGQKARTRAEAIASGLNVRVGQLVSAEEGFVYILGNDMRGTAPGAATTTPIEPGSLEIRAQITVQYETVP
jgi:uncharacterized protein YggE